MNISFLPRNIFLIGGLIVSIFTYSILINLPIEQVDARCPNGYHKSPSGDCEKVTDNEGMPRCPNGYHRSPDGDCERVR